MNLPIEQRIIYDLEKDPNGNIYLLNSKFQILKLQGDKAFPIGPKKTPATYKNYFFIKLHWTKSGLYILTYRNFLKYSFQSKKIHPYYRNVEPDKSFLTYRYEPDHEFPFSKLTHHVSGYLKHQNIIIDFPESGQHFNYKLAAIPDSREDQITVGKATYFIICSKLFRKEGNHITPLNFSRILFIEQFHNRIWLCTYNGLLELDLNGNLLHHHFKGDLVAGVAPLKAGGIAVSFNRKGVFICSNIHNLIYKNITVSSAELIHPYNLIGTTKGGIYQYNNYHLSKLAQTDSLGYTEKIGTHDAINEITLFGKYFLFTSTSGMHCYDRNFHQIKHNTDPRCFYFGLFVDKTNLYFMQRISIRKSAWKDWRSLSFVKYHPFSKLIPINNVRCHLRLNDSIVLLGADEGLFHFNLRTDHLQRSSLFRQEFAIRSLKISSSGEVVVFSRYHGIYIFKGNTLVKRVPLPSVSIMNGLIYKNNLIVQGNDGIFIRPLNHSTEWTKIFNGETESVFALQNSLLISYGNNLIITKIEDYKKDETSIILNTVVLGKTKNKVLPSKIAANNAISLDFDILKFGVDKLDLYYRLKGKNTIRQMVKGTQINFDALESGEYLLEVYPVIDGKIQFQNSKKFQFTVEKTFWESTIFYILIAVILLSIIVSILLLMNLRRKKRSEERSKLESKMNEYKLLAVKAQVNPHFLSNGLAAIQALILKGDNDSAAHYLAKFSYLMRKILYYSETQFISVKQELQLTDAYLELELLRFRNRFEILKEIDLSESQLNEFSFPSLLLQPIFENAIWHGLKFQENNPQLLISLKLNQNQDLVVLISDNGPGFNLSNQSEEHLSKGNKLISERIDALNKQFQKQVASMHISSSTSGTQVTFIFTPELYQTREG
jgi:hypothetical protein